MQFKKTLATATVLGFQLVQAEVYIITPGLPAATATPSFKNKDESSSWEAAVSSEVDDRLFSYIMEQPTSWFDEITSVAGDVEDFVATATVSIPEIVTATDVTTTITAVPEWYTAMPEEFRKVEESLGTVIASISSEVVAQACETGSVKCYSGKDKDESGARGLRSAAGMGAGVAAAVVVGAMIL